METEIDRIDSLNSNALINMEQLSDLDEVDGLELDEDQLAEATDEVNNFCPDFAFYCMWDKEISFYCFKHWNYVVATIMRFSEIVCSVQSNFIHLDTLQC